MEGKGLSADLFNSFPILIILTLCYFEKFTPTSLKEETCLPFGRSSEGKKKELKSRLITTKRKGQGRVYARGKNELYLFSFLPVVQGCI